MIPNTIGAQRRWLLDCAGKCAASSRETCPERSEGSTPLAGTGVRGKAAGLAPLSAVETEHDELRCYNAALDRRSAAKRISWLIV
jgi:hypothetical protein